MILAFTTRALTMLTLFGNRTDLGKDRFPAAVPWPEGICARGRGRPDDEGHASRCEYDALDWEDAPELFLAWCEGHTGYPFVDAAMRERVATGFKHNRARIVTASFLTKNLGIDWRLSERLFARQLLDYVLSSNNGCWQWSASTGCDAQPYFRIFNLVSQSQKYDPEGDNIRRWVPELANLPAKLMRAPGLMSSVDQRGLACGCRVITRRRWLIIRQRASRRWRDLLRFARPGPRRRLFGGPPCAGGSTLHAETIPRFCGTVHGQTLYGQDIGPPPNRSVPS